MNKDIYLLELHENTKVDGNIFVTRVPGGWIYEIPNNHDDYNIVFVPFNNEFMEGNK